MIPVIKSDPAAVCLKWTHTLWWRGTTASAWRCVHCTGSRHTSGECRSETNLNTTNKQTQLWVSDNFRCTTEKLDAALHITSSWDQPQNPPYLPRGVIVELHRDKKTSTDEETGTPAVHWVYNLVCICTFGAHTMCFPGTGSVVMYMVTLRYM